MADSHAAAPPQPIRTMSRGSSGPDRKTSAAAARETVSAFAAFLSDDSNSSDDEDEDDADTRALLRMQQQADDRAYVDTSFRLDRPPEPRGPVSDGESARNSEDVRVSHSLTGPRGSDRQTNGEEERNSGPDLHSDHSFAAIRADTNIGNNVTEDENKVAHDRDSGNNSVTPRPPSFSDSESDGSETSEPSEVAGGPSFGDAHSFTGNSFTGYGDSFTQSDGNTGPGSVRSGGNTPHDSLASRPPSFSGSAGDDSFYDSGKPSFSDVNSFTAAASSFTVRSRQSSPRNSSISLDGARSCRASDAETPDEPSFVSVTSPSSVLGASGPASGVDASFQMPEGPPDSVNGLVHGGPEASELKATVLSAPEAAPEPSTTSPAPDTSLPPLQARGSSASSSSQGLPQLRGTLGRESWRVSALDFRESKHAFDEEQAPLGAQPLSPRLSATASDQPSQRLSSMFEERNSDASSFASVHSQANFFVDDLQQLSFSSTPSLSLASRPSSDSFANVAILGDDVRDLDGRRSSDLTPSSVHVAPPQVEGVAAAYPIATDTLDQSYSDLVDCAVGLNQSFSKLLDRESVYPEDQTRRSSERTSGLGSSTGSSAVSLSSASSDELSFVSFNEAQPPPAAPTAPAPASPSRRKLGCESEQVFYRSMVLPRGPDIPASQPAVSSSPSATLLAAIQTRNARTATRSEETEAGDVAPGALPPLAPPLKISVLPRGVRGSFSAARTSDGRRSSSMAASPLALSSISSMARSSLASSTGTADRLDFTGVYRGSVNSLERSRNADVSAVKPEPELESEPEAKALAASSSGVKLARSMSDSRVLQRASQRKVEEFFRRTYRRMEDDGGEAKERESSRLTTRTTRARTTVIDCVDDVELEPRSFLVAGASAAKIIDLKNLRGGGKRPVWQPQGAAPLTPQPEEEPSKGCALAMTTTSTATTLRSASPDLPQPPNYLLSPQRAGRQLQTKAKAAAAAGGGGFFSASGGAGGDGISRFGAISARRADNVSLTPTLPRLSAGGSPAPSPSMFASSFMNAAGFGGSGGPGMGKSPVAFAGTASGFRWKPDSSLNGFKRSAPSTPFGTTESQTQRPTLADRVQSMSASLASTLRRFLGGHGGQQLSHSADVTSPESQCASPPALPRSYDQQGFFALPFQPPGLRKPSVQQRKKRQPSDRRAWTRQWLVLAVCAVLGLSLGAILVRSVAVDSTVFNLSAEAVRDRQEANGALVLAAATRWLLLPGQLFLRVWEAVTVPLLVCYVATALADLVGCGNKTALVLSFRSLGYALLLALLAAGEGVVAMWLTHRFGWFRGSSSSASATAATVANALGVTPLPVGAVGLLCSQEGEYLQRSGDSQFVCGNASSLLYEQVSVNSSGVGASGVAVFALQETTALLASPTSPSPYYPASLGSLSDVAGSLLASLAPENLSKQFADADSELEVSGLVAFGLLLGFVCGKRLLYLRRRAQAATESSAPTGSRAAGDPPRARHYLLSVLVELQLALEWLVRQMERYLAPVGVFSLLLGPLVLHHREWRAFASPMASLLVGVLLVLVLHAVVMLPLLLAALSSSRQRRRTRGSLLSRTQAFLPTFLFAFVSNNVALSAPVTMQCYARAQTVTRSASQLATGVTAALIRNGRALYLPLLLLWLLETSSADELELDAKAYAGVGLLALLSCFMGGADGSLALARTLWTVAVRQQGASASAASVLPPTLPLLVVCDLLLARVASVVTIGDHLVLTQLVAQYWDETVVEPSGDDQQQLSEPSDALMSPIFL
ncbi:hypothetical protein BBJ28_00004111 [Nothophytophthora sp. Chile5]|nr:hypothetical protein BBJ28_00004111 [Nothophytophthora sp. Chile5]